MFLTRHCTKLSSPARVFLSNKLSLKEKYFGLSYSCQCHNTQTSRLFASTALVQNAARGSDTSKRLQFSPKTLQSNSSETALKPNKPSANDLLEKLIAGLSTDIHNKNRVYKNDLVRVIKKVEEMNFSTKKQGLLLIRCCTEMMPDETPATRMALVEIIWNAIKLHTEFEVEHYNELLRVYIANNRTLMVSTFIQQMAPAKPNVTTYELILRALAEAGDLNQSTEVISNMKSQNLPANENIFNSLIICQGKAGNPQNIQEVLTMMKSLKLEKSIDTYTAVARALAWNKRTPNLLEEMENARSRGLEFGETHIMEIVKTLASIGLYGSIPKVLQFLPDEILKTPSISPYMQSVCTLLVFQNHPLAALEIYKCLPLPSFGPKDDQGLHGRSLVRDCVKAAMPSSVIALVTQELMSSGRNPIALHNASEAALQLGKVPLALDMFTRMQQLGLPIRPHYFWPILLHSSRSYGEKATETSERIVGGSLTTIEEYPEMVALLRVWGNHYGQDCGGSILNNRAILTAAHCTEVTIPAGRRVRVGSSYRSSNGTVYTIERIIIHPGYAFNWPAQPDNDVSILWLTGIIPVTSTSRPALIAGPNYNLADNQAVWATGWGWTQYGNFTSQSEQLRHVQVYTVNQEICRQRFANLVINGVPMPYTITDNMLCSGILDVGGRDQCYGDSGGPVFHHGVQVGICSFGHECALGEFPGVNVRVSQFTNWISENR